MSCDIAGKGITLTSSLWNQHTVDPFLPARVCQGCTAKSCGLTSASTINKGKLLVGRLWMTTTGGHTTWPLDESVNSVRVAGPCEDVRALLVIGCCCGGGSTIRLALLVGSTRMDPGEYPALSSQNFIARWRLQEANLGADACC